MQRGLKLYLRARLRSSVIKAAARTAAIDRAINEMKAIFTQAWSAESQEAIIEAIRLLEQTPKITAAQIKDIEAGLAQRMGNDFAAMVSHKIVPLTESAYLLGARAATKHTGVKFEFGLSDQRSLSVLNDNLRFWVGNHYDNSVQSGIKSALADFFEGDASRRSLIESLAEQMGAQFDASQSYWDMLADHTATKVREIGRVSGYEEAGIKRVEFRANIDERTTLVCRRMNGKILEVKTARKSVDKYLKTCETGNPEKIKRSWKWWTDAEIKKLSDKDLQALIDSGKIFFPPLHARCRSITVAYFGD